MLDMGYYLRVFLKMFINDDDFVFDGVPYGFNYRCIDGDLSLPHNFLCSPHFQPHGNNNQLLII